MAALFLRRALPIPAVSQRSTLCARVLQKSPQPISGFWDLSLVFRPLVKGNEDSGNEIALYFQWHDQKFDILFMTVNLRLTQLLQTLLMKGFCLWSYCLWWKSSFFGPAQTKIYIAHILKEYPALPGETKESDIKVALNEQVWKKWCCC